MSSHYSDGSVTTKHSRIDCRSTLCIFKGSTSDIAVYFNGDFVDIGDVCEIVDAAHFVEAVWGGGCAHRLGYGK